MFLITLSFQVNLCKETTKRREDWKENETVPSGWKVRTSTGNSEREYILRPDGQQYMSRINALQHLIKQGYNDADIFAMKTKLCYEGWTTSEYLPSGWLYKIICEGYTKDNKWYNTISYFSSEDELLESMKHVQEHMEKHPRYDDNDIENTKIFLETQKSQEKKHNWEEGDETIPKNWKMRISETENKWQFFLSPEGKQYRSRFVAIQDMAKRSFYSVKHIDEMRELMIKHEQWQRSEYLPRDWIFKINWEGTLTSGKYSDNLYYMSRECVVFGSNITAVDYMKESPFYTEEDEARCKEFSKRRNQETQEMRFEWLEGDHTLPKGWKMRKSGEREYILSPVGIQYMSRVVSLTDMVKRGCREADIEEMRSKLKYEGETTNSFDKCFDFNLTFDYRMEDQTRVPSKRLVLENVGRRDKETET